MTKNENPTQKALAIRLFKRHQQSSQGNRTTVKDSLATLKGAGLIWSKRTYYNRKRAWEQEEETMLSLPTASDQVGSNACQVRNFSWPYRDISVPHQSTLDSRGTSPLPHRPILPLQSFGPNTSTSIIATNGSAERDMECRPTENLPSKGECGSDSFYLQGATGIQRSDVYSLNADAARLSPWPLTDASIPIPNFAPPSPAIRFLPSQDVLSSSIIGRKQDARLATAEEAEDYGCLGWLQLDPPQSCSPILSLQTTCPAAEESNSPTSGAFLDTSFAKTAPMEAVAPTVEGLGSDIAQSPANSGEVGDWPSQLHYTPRHVVSRSSSTKTNNGMRDSGYWSSACSATAGNYSGKLSPALSIKPQDQLAEVCEDTEAEMTGWMSNLVREIWIQNLNDPRITEQKSTRYDHHGIIPRVGNSALVDAATEHSTSLSNIRTGHEAAGPINITNISKDATQNGFSPQDAVLGRTNHVDGEFGSLSLPQPTFDASIAIRQQSSNKIEATAVLPKPAGKNAPLHLMHQEYACVHKISPERSQRVSCERCGFSSQHHDAAAGWQNSGSWLEEWTPTIGDTLKTERPDRYNNTLLHYFSSSGMATLKTLLELRARGADFFARNTFGETPLHVLSLTRMSGADLRSLLAKLIESSGHQPLAQCRDNRGRTILHALIERSLPFEKLQAIFVDRKHPNGVRPPCSILPTLRDLLNKLDNSGATPGHRLFSPAFQNMFQAIPPETQEKNTTNALRSYEHYNQILELLEANGAKKYQFKQFRGVCETTTHEREEMLEIIIKAQRDRQRLLAENHLGRNVIHCLAYVLLDPSDRLETLRWALDARVYKESTNSNVSIDVNGFDVDGNTPLHCTILEAGDRQRSPRQITANLESIICNAATVPIVISDLLSVLKSSQDRSFVCEFVEKQVDHFQLNDSTPLPEFLARLRDWETKPGNAADRDLAIELLSKSDGSLHRKRHSVGVSAQRNKAIRSANRSSEQPSRTESISIVEEYIRNGADIDIRDRQGRTPLHLACLHGLTGFTEALLKHGANVHARDDSGIGIVTGVTACLDAYGDCHRASLSKCIRLVRAAGALDIPTAQDEFFTRCKYCGKHRHLCRHALEL